MAGAAVIDGELAANLPRQGGSDHDFMRKVVARGDRVERRRIVAEKAQDLTDRHKEKIRRIQEGPAPNRSFPEQIEAMRKLCDRQLALLELTEEEHGVLPVNEFRMVQKLAFILRTLGQESRAQANGWDASKATDKELQEIAGGNVGEEDL